MQTFSIFMSNHKPKDMTKLEEIWLPIIGFENYLISNLGNVKSLPKRVTLFHGSSYLTKEKLLTPRLSKHNRAYKMVALFNGSVLSRVDKKIHSLVAAAFIHNPHNKPFINHIDGNKMNNIATNLEWCTNAENMEHAAKIGLMSKGKNHFNYGKSGLNASYSKAVINKNTGKICNVKQAAKLVGYSATHMTSMLKGIRTNKTDFIYVI